MNKDIFFKLFSKIFFLNLKETKNMSLNSFKNWSNNILFSVLFEKVNEVMVVFGWRIKPSYKQKKRLYALFQTVNSQAISVNDLLDQLLNVCRKHGVSFIYEKTIQVLEINIETARGQNDHYTKLDIIQNVEEDELFNNDERLNILPYPSNKHIDHPHTLSSPINKLNENIVNLDNSTDSKKLNIDTPNSTSLENSTLINTEVFNKPNIMSSTTNTLNLSDSTTTQPEIEEYKILRNRIRQDRELNIIIPTDKDKTSLRNFSRKSTIYTKYEAKIIFSMRENAFIKEYFKSINKYDKMVAFLEDIIREKFKKFNNMCPITYTSFAWNKGKTILFLYAKCIYYTNGCGRYRFAIMFTNNGIDGQIESNGVEINHPIALKPQQIRNIRRIMAKHELKYEKASNWRNKKLSLQKKSLRNIGNDQEVPSRDVTRKIKSEQMRTLQKDDDIFIDIYKMQKSKHWSNFIQHIGNPMEIYFFSIKQFQILHQNNKRLLRLSRNTLFFDATGNVVRKVDLNSKRVFLYSLVANIRQKEERGILLPVAEALLCSHYSEDIEKFFIFIKIFCVKNSIMWPICKRICVDWSFPSINAISRVFNKDFNIHTLEQYISKSYNICKKKPPKINIVVIQICCAHLMRIASKDIEAHFDNMNIINFYKWQFMVAINICDITSFFYWIEHIFIILLNKHETKQVNESLSKLKRKETYIKIEEREGNIENILDKQNIPNYKKSPYYLKSSQIYDKIKKNLNLSEVFNKYYNERFALLILKKYSSYAPLWTNIMGAFIDKNHSRVSNSAVESYFNITKNITLEGNSKVVPSQYIRKINTYINAKINDAENTYIADLPSKSPKVKKIKLDEDIWKRTPKKSKKKVTSAMYQKICNQYSTWPRSIKELRYILFSYRNLFRNKTVSYPLTIDLIEFNSLNPTKCLYNNIVDIYLNILISENNKSAYTLSCEEGNIFFYTDHNVELPLTKFNFIIIPIIRNHHYTVAYLDVKQKHFYFMDSLSKKKNNTIFTAFTNKIEEESWENREIEYDCQTDSFNCGIFVVQYVEALLHNKELTNLNNPNVYRNKIKEMLAEYADDMAETCVHCGDMVIEPPFMCNECKRPACIGCTKYRYKMQINIKDEIKCIFCEK